MKQRSHRFSWPKGSQKYISLFIIFGFVWLILRTFTIQHIECSTNNGACTDQMQSSLAKLFVDKSLFFTDIEALVARSPSMQGFALAEYYKKMPSTLRLTLAEEPLLYGLTTPANDFFSVSNKGTIKKFAKDSGRPNGLPSVSVTDEAFLSVLQQDSLLVLPQQYHAPLSALIPSLYKHGITFHNIVWVAPDTIQLLVSDRVVLLDTKNPAGGVEGLKQILDMPEGSTTEPVKEIDMRFTLPVLRTR